MCVVLKEAERIKRFYALERRTIPFQENNRRTTKLPFELHVLCLLYTSFLNEEMEFHVNISTKKQLKAVNYVVIFL